MSRGGKRPGSGRKPGQRSASHVSIATFATSIVEDPQVQATMRLQAREGLLPVPLFTLLFHYAYGRPREQERDDQAFMEDLVSVVLKHAESPEARREIREVLEAHTGGARLSLVAS